MQQLTILPDIEELLPPLSPEEYEGLKADMIANGCRDALVVWQDTIIDGHNRYSIALEHNIPFKTVEMTFESISDAKLWVIQNQSSRRNLSAYSRTVLALQMKPFLEEKAKRRQGTRTDLNNFSANSPRSFEEPREQIAKIAGVGSNAVSRIEYIEANADEETKEKLRRGDKDVSVNSVYTSLKEANTAEQSKPGTSLTVTQPIPIIATSVETESEETNEDFDAEKYEEKIFKCFLDILNKKEPRITLQHVSKVQPSPLVGAIFDLFTPEYRREFLKSFVQEFAKSEGKENAELFFVQVIQAIK